MRRSKAERGKAAAAATEDLPLIFAIDGFSRRSPHVPAMGMVSVHGGLCCESERMSASMCTQTESSPWKLFSCRAGGWVWHRWEGRRRR